jgi:glycosyltransferase involved in cell wall biosynthesis
MFGTLRERSPLHPLLEDIGCETVTLQAGGAMSYVGCALGLRRLVDLHKVDLLHCAEYIQGAVGGLALVGSKRCQSLFHRHNTHAKGKDLALCKAAGRLNRMTMAVSSAAAEAARAEGVHPSRIRVALNGIENPRPVSGQEIASLKESLMIQSSDRVLVVVGHLRPEKGHRHLFEAFRKLTENRKNLHLVVVGTGPELPNLRSFSNGLGIHVHFVGHQSDVSLWNALADIVVIPSLKESFGLVALEAMASARPLVASSVGGLKEVVEQNRSGLLCNPGDPSALATEIDRVLNSTELAARLSREALARFRNHFSLSAMVTAWERCYAELLSRSE